MVEKENRDQKEKISAPGLSPFRYSLYRAFWMSLPPQLSIKTTNTEGQALITIDYKIDPKLSEEFEEMVLELGNILKSEGMVYWKLFQDPADINHYLEIRIADTWT
ncbi:MAG TPA: MFS transporter, partial [Candidatus Bathyarchaeia archaeon]|nr:MFS transporter [Candidatus Bathyarchaeia archaeon]